MTGFELWTSGFEATTLPTRPQPLPIDCKFFDLFDFVMLITTLKG